MIVDNKRLALFVELSGFLKDYGPHFTINRMITFDSVKLRLIANFNFLELNYMLYKLVIFTS